MAFWKRLGYTNKFGGLIIQQEKISTFRIMRNIRIKKEDRLCFRDGYRARSFYKIRNHLPLSRRGNYPDLE